MTDFALDLTESEASPLLPRETKGRKLHGRSQIRSVSSPGRRGDSIDARLRRLDDLIVAGYMYAFGASIPFVRESAQVEMVRQLFFLPRNRGIR